MFRCMALAALGVAMPLLSKAASVSRVSPQGEVAQVRQVTVTFSEAAVRLGDLRQADPLAVACEGAAPKGSGRWLNDRVWAYDFEGALPPGVRCTLKARPEWSPLGGSLRGRTDFSFNTGGPAIITMQPWDRSVIEEDQHFLLQLNGAAVEMSMLANSWCEVDGIGERLPVRIVSGPLRDELLKARRLTRQADRALVLTCSRPLPFDAAMRFVWGKGIAAMSNPSIVTRIEQRFRFQVRKPFTAEFNCERERAGAACWPVLPMTLRFSAPIARALAEKIRLRPAGADGAATVTPSAPAPATTAGAVAGGLAPVFDKPGAPDEEVQAITFPRPLAENASF